MALPSGYTQLKYIESSGTQYIDTGIKPNQNTSMVADVAFLGSAGNNVLGARNSSSDATNRFGIITYSRSSKFGCFFGTSSIEGSSIDTNSHVFEISSSGFSVDGINYGNPGTQNFSCSYPITIGAWNNGSSGIVCAASKIKSVKIYDAAALVRDYVPALRNSDGTVGMYDMVNAVFYTNEGSGVFEAGPEAGLSGYTRLKYIKATGSQYINTGFKPNQDTTVEFSVLNAAANQYYFGAWNVAYNNGAFAYCNDPSNVYIGYDGQGGGTGSVITGNHVIKLEKNIAYLDGAVFSSYTYTAFQVNYPLFLFGQNRAGQFFTNADGGIYCEYCKIYDNGTLVRYLVPVMRNSDSTIGMYDTVNDVFYTNSGSGSFEAGPVAGPQGHRTMADGTSFEITAGRVMVDGTMYDIKNGRTLVGGTLFDIEFKNTLYDLSCGDMVYLNVNGVPTEFIIVQQDRPSEIYDESCAGIWLLMNKIDTKGRWHTSDINDYENSSIHRYLNSTFLSLLDVDIQSVIKQVKLPYRPSDGYHTTVQSGTAGLPAKIFLLSGAELNWSSNISSSIPNDGACLSYFAGCAKQDSKRVAKLNGTNTNWWTRSPCCNMLSGSEWVIYVDTDGDYNHDICSNTYGIRPALILPSDLSFDKNFNVII